MLKEFFQAVNVKKGNINKPTYVEIFKIHENQKTIRNKKTAGRS